MLKRSITAAIAVLALGASSVFGVGGAKADGNDIIGPIIIGAAIGGLIIAATNDDHHYAHRAPKRRHNGHGRYKRHSGKQGYAYRGHSRSRVQVYNGRRAHSGYISSRSGYDSTERRRERARDELDNRRARAEDQLERRRDRAQDELENRRARAQDNLDRRRARAQDDRRNKRQDAHAKLPRQGESNGRYVAWRN